MNTCYCISFIVFKQLPYRLDDRRYYYIGICQDDVFNNFCQIIQKLDENCHENDIVQKLYNNYKQAIFECTELYCNESLNEVAAFTKIFVKSNKNKCLLFDNSVYHILSEDEIKLQTMKEKGKER